MIPQKLKELKNRLYHHKIDGYIIPKNDEYFSEFASKDKLKTITGFDGSFGLAIILKKKNFLFVDGRYVEQAKIQAGKNFQILEIPKKLPYQILNPNLNLGFDPMVFTSRNLNYYFRNKNKLSPINTTLIKSDISKNFKSQKFYTLKPDIVGETANNKIKRLIQILKKDGADHIFITAPENVAWLLNIRGRDNPFSPIPNCRVILNKKGKISFFSNIKNISYIQKKKDFIKTSFFNENQIISFLNNLNAKKIIIDKTTCSFFFENLLNLKFKISNIGDPLYFMKSIKNKVEIKNTIKSHIYDGVAVTKFLYWIKKNQKRKVSEIDAEKKLESFRKQNKNYLFPSFNTISATGKNGSIIHYRSSNKTCREIKRDDIYLCDSGGQYNYGTTDVTRTIAFKEQPKNIKDTFTRVLKGHIAVATANISKQKTGSNIDKLARRCLKKVKKDFSHGTGHGVGYFLNVHEGPQAISKRNYIKLREGMILSNEPGFYSRGKYGIRIENLVYIKKEKNNLVFKNLTLAPIDMGLVNVRLLSSLEKKYLINYHFEVYSKIHKFLSLNEKKWLLQSI
ncbi:aminopeptidase family protein P [Candidatus Pelagibacter communis]|uniref:aminopeptidase family protein P n=1 Tax=Pelagibacter ubique TaxID=198252 RepID=UPI00094DD405|nr:aminopeptidase P family protein [Candidatus Pelagibacter ubique]